MSAGLFWEESERTIKRPVVYEAEPITIYHCGESQCHISLPDFNVSGIAICTRGHRNSAPK